MDEQTKAVITQRLANTASHLSGSERMACEDAYCIDLIRQIQAAQAALNKVNVIMLTIYLDACVLVAVWGKDIAERERMLKEVCFSTSSIRIKREVSMRNAYVAYTSLISI